MNPGSIAVARSIFELVNFIWGSGAVQAVRDALRPVLTDEENAEIDNRGALYSARIAEADRRSDPAWEAPLLPGVGGPEEEAK